MINLRTGETFTPDPADVAIAALRNAVNYTPKAVKLSNETAAVGAQVLALIELWRSFGFRRLLVEHAPLELSKKGLYTRLYGGQKWLLENGTPEQQALVFRVMFISHQRGYVMTQRAGHVKVLNLADAASVLNESTPGEQVIADLIDFVATGAADAEFVRPCPLSPALFELTDAELTHVTELSQHPQLLVSEITARKVALLKLSPDDI